MFLSGMITHGDFMLTLVLLLFFSFILCLFCSFSVCFIFNCIIFPILCTYWCFHFYVVQSFKLVYFLSMYKASNVFFFLFTFQDHNTYSINHCHKLIVAAEVKQTNKDVIFCRTKSPEINSNQHLKFQNIVRPIHNMGNLIGYYISLSFSEYLGQ